MARSGAALTLFVSPYRTSAFLSPISPFALGRGHFTPFHLRRLPPLPLAHLQRQPLHHTLKARNRRAGQPLPQLGPLEFSAFRACGCDCGEAARSNHDEFFAAERQSQALQR